MPGPEPQTITKKELVNRIAEQTKQTKVVVKDILQQFLEEIVSELSDGNRLEFREFGVFEVKKRAARLAQNPRTLEKVYVPAKKVVRFKVGRMMRERVCEEPAEGAESSEAPTRRAAPQTAPATKSKQPPSNSPF
jgi:integration host factor subunit beta